MSAIVVEQLSKQFAREPRPVVDHVSFEVEDGAFVVLLGPSGCGKTTLLKMINRLYEPTSGRILVGGMDARSLKATELRRRIGYAIQQTGLFPHMRIEQNIAVVPRLLGWAQPRIDARIDELLELVGLPRSYRTRYPRQLSGGEQQRVGLARALAADPAIMLMDEPFGAIDAITRARLQEELAEIQRKLRKTIIFVTHDVEEALRLADKIIIMREGTIVQYDTPLNIIIMREGTIVQYDTPLNIITRPRDTFVRDLTGADDVLRRLSLLSVRDALGAGRNDNGAAAIDSQPHSETIRIDDNLRDALARLLRSGAELLPIVGPNGEQLDQLSLDQLRGIAQDKMTR